MPKVTSKSSPSVRSRTPAPPTPSSSFVSSATPPPTRPSPPSPAASAPETRALASPAGAPGAPPPQLLRQLGHAAADQAITPKSSGERDRDKGLGLAGRAAWVNQMRRDL